MTDVSGIVLDEESLSHVVWPADHFRCPSRTATDHDRGVTKAAAKNRTVPQATSSPEVHDGLMV